MLLGVYICDRGEPPKAIRTLNGAEQETYVVGRPFEAHKPDISLHHGKISKRHLIIIYEDPGYWTVTAIGKNMTYLVRNGVSRCLSKGDAVPIEDDDCVELLGANYSLTFKTDLSQTISEAGDTTTISDDEDDDEENRDWVAIAIELYQKMGMVERLIVMVTAIAVVIALVLLKILGLP